MSTELPSHHHHHHDQQQQQQQQPPYPRPRQHRHTNTSLSNDGPYFFRSLIWGLYKNSQYTDFTIRIKGSAREFHVHRAVICPQSEIFEAACRGSFIVCPRITLSGSRIKSAKG